MVRPKRGPPVFRLLTLVAFCKCSDIFGGYSLLYMVALTTGFCLSLKFGMLRGQLAIGSGLAYSTLLNTLTSFVHGSWNFHLQFDRVELTQMATTDTQVAHTFLGHVLFPCLFLAKSTIDYCSDSTELDFSFWVLSIIANDWELVGLAKLSRTSTHY